MLIWVLCMLPGITANKDMNFALKKQEVHALCGENGAGKSTLMSILFGLYEPDEGQIYINGQPVKIKNSNQATAYRIGMVYQHFKLVKTFSALQNIVLGIEPTKLGFLNTESVREKVKKLSKQYKFNIDLDMKISDMTVGMQQKVEILKMLFRDNDILIFDEPTAVLLPQETEELLETIRMLVKEGKSVIFISHKLDEIMEVADRCTILRKGKYVGTYVIKDTNVSELSRRMVGREVDLKPKKNVQKVGENILSVRNLIVKDPAVGKNVVNDVSFDVRKGEICCIAGIDGNGQTELIYAISGLIKIDSGSVMLNGEECADKNVRYRNQQGMSHIPEDRHRHGLILDYTVAQNAILETHYTEEMARKGILKRQYIIDYRRF